MKLRWRMLASEAWVLCSETSTLAIVARLDNGWTGMLRGGKGGLFIGSLESVARKLLRLVKPREGSEGR